MGGLTILHITMVTLEVIARGRELEYLYLFCPMATTYLYVRMSIFLQIKIRASIYFRALFHPATKWSRPLNGVRLYMRLASIYAHSFLSAVSLEFFSAQFIA